MIRPITHFMRNLNTVSLYSVLRFAMEMTSLDRAFKHTLYSNIKHSPNRQAFFAAITAEGIGLGIDKMAEAYGIFSFCFNYYLATMKCGWNLGHFHFSFLF
jgi:hypothetical protein